MFDYLEGAQLLCLIDKGLDACRYLQSYEEWEHAAWLAKVGMDCYWRVFVGTVL